MSTDKKFDDLHKQMFDEGLKMRRSVVGDAYVDRAVRFLPLPFSYLPFLIFHAHLCNPLTDTNVTSHSSQTATPNSAAPAKSSSQNGAGATPGRGPAWTRNSAACSTSAC